MGNLAIAFPEKSEEERKRIAKKFYHNFIDFFIETIKHLETVLFRIAQEALTNALRHSGARRVSLVVERRQKAILMVVEDDGLGFDVEAASQSGRLGLAGMRERAEMLGGTLLIESSPGSGTTLVVEVPHVS